MLSAWLKQELELLNQFDTKDRALSTKMDKQQHDKKEVVTAISSCKTKLSATQAEAEVCTPGGCVYSSTCLDQPYYRIPVTW